MVSLMSDSKCKKKGQILHFSIDRIENHRNEQKETHLDLERGGLCRFWIVFSEFVEAKSGANSTFSIGKSRKYVTKMTCRSD